MARRVNRFRLATGLGLAIISTILGLALAEIVLRVEIDHLPTVWGNALGSGYVDFANGIYRFDPALNMERMRPHYERKMFFNGYHWLHRTDWMGFRNPIDRKRVDIALIGDSMVYGHGLDESETVRSHLERMLGRPVANLSEQGGAMDYEYEILKHDAVRLHPRYVFIFFFNNDISDVEGRLSDGEMRRFLELPVGDHTTRYFILKPTPHLRRGDWSMRNLYVRRSAMLLEHLLSARIAGYLASRHPTRPVVTVSAPAPSSTVAMAGNPTTNSASASARPAWMTQPPFAADPRMQLAMQFHLRAILKAQDFAARHAMRMAYVFIAVPLPYDSLYEEIIAAYCRTNGIDFFSLRPALDAARANGTQIYLTGDGHFSNAGTAITAQALADHFHLRDSNSWR